MKLVPEVGFVGGGITHAGFVCGEAGSYTGVEIGGELVSKVGVGIKFARIWPPAVLVGGGGVGGADGVCGRMCGVSESVAQMLGQWRVVRRRAW